MRIEIGKDLCGFIVALDLAKPVPIAMLCGTESHAFLLADEIEEARGERPAVTAVVVNVRLAAEADKA